MRDEILLKLSRKENEELENCHTFALPKPIGPFV
jgi:hypothetical protein